MGSNLVYAPVHEYGATIVPVNKRALHWVDQEGQEHFAKRVKIPPRPYLQPSMQAKRDEIPGVILKTTEELFER